MSQSTNPSFHMPSLEVNCSPFDIITHHPSRPCPSNTVCALCSRGLSLGAAVSTKQSSIS